MDSHPVIAAESSSIAMNKSFKIIDCNEQIIQNHRLQWSRTPVIAPASEIHKDLPTGLKESSPSRQKSESSPSTQKSTPTAMKFKTEISADCEIEKDLKIAQDMKRKQALLNWKWDAVIDLEDDASDDGWDADEENDSDEDNGSDGHSQTELTTTPPRKTVKRPRVTVNKRHRPSVVSQEWTWA